MNDLQIITESFESTAKMPVLFLGHGSPMNAIAENEFVQGFRKVSSEIGTPKAILCISAHWEARGTMVTAMEKPPTLHDFGGFPEELYAVKYPAPGSPELAQKIKKLVSLTTVHLVDAWGLDHGSWSVLLHMYPKADVPVIQLSLDSTIDSKDHYELGKELSSLREKGILIVGSGNLIHNLRMLDWGKLNDEFAYDWAYEAGSLINQYILDGNHDKLIDYSEQGKAFQLSIPTREHFLPLLYILALRNQKDSITLFNDRTVGGSLSMTSVKIG